MKGIDKFKETIKAHLDKRAEGDEVFARKLQKINLDLLVAYIASCVKALKSEAFADDEIYQMAVHYVDEEGNVKVDYDAVKHLTCVVSPGELTEEDKEKARQQAIEEMKRQEMERMKRKPQPKPQPKQAEDKNEPVKHQQLELF